MTKCALRTGEYYTVFRDLDIDGGVFRVRWVELTLGAGIRHKLEGETAQLPLPVCLLTPRLHELVYSIAADPIPTEPANS